VRTQMAGRDRAGQRLSRGRRAGRRSSLVTDGRVAGSRSEQEPDSDRQSETSHVS
jgi:peroxiredoxin